MKLKIEIPFKDKYTGRRYKIGEEIEFADDRAAELLDDKRHLVSAEVAADEITAVGEDGSETPLTELEPDLAGETVTVDGGETVEKPKRSRKKK